MAKTNSTKKRASAKQKKSPAASKFQYKKRSAAKWQENAAAAASGGREMFFDEKRCPNVFTPRDGKNKVRILPPTWDDPEHYAMLALVHYGIGPDKAAFMCLRNLNKDCPVCEERLAAKAEGDEEMAGELRPAKRALVYVIDRNEESKGVQLWPMPSSIDEEICTRAVTEDGEVVPLDHPEDGYDVTFKRSGQGRNTKYTAVEISRSSSPLMKDSDDMDNVLEFAVENPLPDILIYRDEEHISKTLGVKPKSEDEDEDEDEDEEETEDEEEDEDEDEDEESEEEEDEDEDDDEDEEEDDEEEDEDESELPESWDELKELDEEMLTDLVDDNDLDVDVDDYEDDESGLRKAVAKALGIKPPTAKKKKAPAKKKRK